MGRMIYHHDYDDEVCETTLSRRSPISERAIRILPDARSTARQSPALEMAIEEDLFTDPDREGPAFHPSER